MGDPWEEIVQIELLGQLFTDHFFAHLLGFFRLLVSQHVSLRLENLPINGPMGKWSLAYDCFAFSEVEVDESLAVLVVLHLELDVDIAYLGIVVVLLQGCHTVIFGLALRLDRVESFRCVARGWLQGAASETHWHGLACLDEPPGCHHVLWSSLVLLYVELAVDDVLVVHRELELQHLAVPDEGTVAQGLELLLTRGLTQTPRAMGLLLGRNELQLETLVDALMVEQG